MVKHSRMLQNRKQSTITENKSQTKSAMTPQQYIEFWDGYMRRWYNDMEQHHTRSLQIWEDFFSQYPFDITELMYYRYFPEPYFGNPKSENLQAVFINLNPGQGGKDQDFYPKGKLLDYFRGVNLSYYNTMRALITFSNREKPHLILGKTLEWWVKNRVKWVNETFERSDGKTTTLNDILGLELIPWHTKSFGEIAITLNTTELNQYVFEPAAKISKSVINKWLCSNGASIVIGRGLQSVVAVRDMLDFKPCVSELPENLNKKWNVHRAMLDDTTILIDFTKKKGGFGMKLPTTSGLKTFFADEINTLQTAII